MKRLILALMLVTLVVFVANATPPPAQGGYLPGWGMNPTNWQTATGSFSSWGLYDPLYGGAGAAWVVGWLPTVYITYAPITLELWIEMYCLQTYHYTSYQWHRLGNLAETISFVIEGTIQTNNGQYVQLMQGTQALTNLWFVHNIFGGNSPIPAPNIPITWQGRWGLGLVYGANTLWGWQTLTPDPDLTMLIPDPCDHWFQFEGTFVIPYHQPDGYYSLTMAGCPAPVM